MNLSAAACDRYLSSFIATSSQTVVTLNHHRLVGHQLSACASLRPNLCCRFMSCPSVINNSITNNSATATAAAAENSKKTSPMLVTHDTEQDRRQKTVDVQHYACHQSGRGLTIGSSKNVEQGQNVYDVARNQADCNHCR
jgi:hypothetical protein